MKKRILAILILALTLAIFAFSAYAAPLVRDDIENQVAYTTSGYGFFFDSNFYQIASNVTLDEGLYIVDIDGIYNGGEINDLGFLFGSSQIRVYEAHWQG